MTLKSDSPRCFMTLNKFTVPGYRSYNALWQIRIISVLQTQGI